MIPMFLSSPNAEVVAISDVLEPRMGQAMEMLGRGARPQKPDRYVEYRRMLERGDIDAVVISTTQHWHGLPHIHACQAGKHIFVEKPLSHTVAEGRAMVRATQKHGVIAMMGTQQRSGPHYQKAVELIRGGRLGKVALVECWNYHNTGKRAGHPADGQAPAGHHWDLWLGPAPAVPYNPGRIGYNSWFFDYSGGMMTNWAIHHIDIILWAMAAEAPTAISCSGGRYVVDDIADTPDTIEASWQFAGGWMMQYSYRGFNNFHKHQSRPSHHGICFHGTKATMILDRHGWEIWEESDPKQVGEKMSAAPYFQAADPMRSEQDGPWQRLFIDTIRSGSPTPLDLEASHQGTVCCHLANIAYLTGRTLKWDAKREVVLDDPQASQLLDRPRRRGYELPQV
jgi:predicted dehydrogenase